MRRSFLSGGYHYSEPSRNGFDCVKWIYLAQRLTFVNMVIYLWVFTSGGQFIDS
jgi:hypothetical protein